MRNQYTNEAYNQNLIEEQIILYKQKKAIKIKKVAYSIVAIVLSLSIIAVSVALAFEISKYRDTASEAPAEEEEITTEPITEPSTEATTETEVTTESPTTVPSTEATTETTTEATTTTQPTTKPYSPPTQSHSSPTWDDSENLDADNWF